MHLCGTHAHHCMHPCLPAADRPTRRCAGLAVAASALKVTLGKACIRWAPQSVNQKVPATYSSTGVQALVSTCKLAPLLKPRQSRALCASEGAQLHAALRVLV